MEELVGEIWHKIITRTVVDDFDDAKAELNNLTLQLSPFYRAMGGDASKMLEATDLRPL